MGIRCAGFQDTMNLLYHTFGQRFRCPIYDEVYATKVVGGFDYIINSDGNVGDTYRVCLENIASLFFGQPTSLNKDGNGGGKGSSEESEAIKKLQQQIDEMKAEKSRSERTATINAAFEKHQIPAFLRDRLAKSISDDEDVEEAVSALKQDCITNGLMSNQADGAKAASEKQVDEAADALLESITVK